MISPSLATPHPVDAIGMGAMDAHGLAVAASRLVGTRCSVAHVLSERPLPSGGTALVVGLVAADGTGLVAKSAPPRLISAGLRAQAAAATSTGHEDGVLRVPRLIAAEPGLAVSEWAPGVPLSKLVRRGDLDAVRLTGRALAEVSRLPTDGRARGISDHLAELVTPHPDALAPTGLPEALVLALQETARAALAAEVTGLAGMVHRDVHPRQLLVDGSRVWLLDWDLAACGDPALDLANLIQHSRYRLSTPLSERVVEALLEGYAPSGDLLLRLPALEAFSAVRLACKAARLQGAAAAAAVTTLVGRARAALASVAMGDRRG